MGQPDPESISRDRTNDSLECESEVGRREFPISKENVPGRESSRWTRTGGCRRFFSNHWKLFRHFFQSLEDFEGVFPIVGKCPEGTGMIHRKERTDRIERMGRTVSRSRERGENRTAYVRH